MSRFTTTHHPEWSIDDYAARVKLEYNPDLKPGMVWVDTETTGLSKKGQDRTLEMGMLLTDDDGVLIDVFHSFVKGPDWYTVILEMNDFCRDMHRTSGFIDEWEKYVEDPDMPSFDVEEVQNQALGWLEFHHLLREPNTYEMCGNSVWFDKRMLIQDFPSLENWFFYRQIDVSTLKQLCKKHNPRVAAHWKAQEPAIKPHRALLDIAQSVREYRYYVENFLWVAK